METIINCVKTT